jgi:hypothetical protein
LEEIAFERGKKRHNPQILKEFLISFLGCQKGNRGIGVDLLYPLNFFRKQKLTFKAENVRSQEGALGATYWMTRPKQLTH